MTSYFNLYKTEMLDTVMTFEQSLPVSLHNPEVQPGTAQMDLLGLGLSLQLHHQTKERKHTIKLSFAKFLWR